MSYKLSFHNKNVHPYFGAKQGQMLCAFQVLWTSFLCCHSPLLSHIFKYPRLEMVLRSVRMLGLWLIIELLYIQEAPFTTHLSSCAGTMESLQLCIRDSKAGMKLELLFLNAKIAKNRLFDSSVGALVWLFRHLNVSTGCSGPEQQPRKNNKELKPHSHCERTSIQPMRHVANRLSSFPLPHKKRERCMRNLLKQNDT